VGTGHLYVQDPDKPNMMVPERRKANFTEFDESLVVQYLTLGGFTDFTNDCWTDVSDCETEDQSMWEAKQEDLQSRYYKMVYEGSHWASMPRQPKKKKTRSSSPSSSSDTPPPYEGAKPKKFCRSYFRPRKPTRVCSGLHHGTGRQTFGFSHRERCDLLLHWAKPKMKHAPDDRLSHKRPALLFYHNFHETGNHYKGHMNTCPSFSVTNHLVWDPKTARLDAFRKRYALAMSAVFPDCVRFAYTVSTSCHYLHKRPIRSLKYRRVHSRYEATSFRSAAVRHYNVRDLLREEFGTYTTPTGQIRTTAEHVFLPPTYYERKATLTKDELTSKILSGKLEGFVTVIGGRYDPPQARGRKHESAALGTFGFCVQNYAPKLEELSRFTLEQMARHYGLDPGNRSHRQKLRNILAKLPPRTLNSNFSTKKKPYLPPTFRGSFGFAILPALTSPTLSATSLPTSRPTISPRC